jgi:DNA-binding transcriptional MerR regulator
MKSLPPDKRYFSTGEVAELLQVNSSLLRYWEQEFSEIKPMKNGKGDRRYMVKDIEILKKIHYLLKEKGFTIEGAKKELQNTADSKNQTLLIEKLKRIKKDLIILKDKL